MKTSSVCLLFSIFVTVRAPPPVPDFVRFGIRSVTPANTPFGFGGGSYDEIAKFAAPSTQGGGAIFDSVKPSLPTPAPRNDFAVKSGDIVERGPEVSSPSSAAHGSGSSPFDFNALFQQISPFLGIPSSENGGSVGDESQPGVVTSFEALQQSSSSSGKSQGHRESMHNEGESNGNSTAGKEVYSTKESFGQETSASHAIGASQDSAAQNSESSRHENGHRIQTLSHGTNVLSSPIERPSMVGNGAFHNANESNSAVNNSQTLLASSSQDAFIPAAPAVSISGEKFSNGGRESSQTNSSNSSAYSVGSSDSKSFAHSESLGDKQAFVNGGANKHASQTQRGSESTQIDGSTSTNKFKETSFVQG